jgi:hypothetical protein
MNWMAYNFAHDVTLPGSSGAPLGFFMYPQAETTEGRLDCLDPDGFKMKLRPVRSRPRVADEKSCHLTDMGIAIQNACFRVLITLR